MCTLPTDRIVQDAELARLLACQSRWTELQLQEFNETKNFIVGRMRSLPPLAAYGNNYRDKDSMGWWDARRRATMLEPLAADILLGDNRVPGDFLEAGVFRGGTSLHLATILRAAGDLGVGRRRMWMADAFGAGMPGKDYIHRVASRTRVRSDTIQTQGKDWTGFFKGEDLSLEAVTARVARGLGFHPPAGGATRALEAAGVFTVSGYFNESLPGPVRARRLALLRIDVDDYAATYEALERLYPLLSPGGYVVLDDWKVWQSQQAALHYRRTRGITSPIFASRRDWPHPLQTIDCMAFWRKAKGKGETFSLV